MATYPVINQDYKSTRKPIENKKIDVASDGTLRTRKDYSETVYKFNIIHFMITETEKDSIQTFYDSNDSLEFTFNYDSDSTDYNLIFESEPYFEMETEDFWTVTTKAVGHKL